MHFLILIIFYAGVAVLCIFALVVVGQALTPSSYLTQGDVERLRAIFSSTLPYGTDLQSIHYSILGFSLLDDSLQDAQVNHDMTLFKRKVTYCQY